MTRKKTPGKKTTVTTEYTNSEQEGLDPFESALDEFGAADELALQIYRYKEDDPGTPAYVKKIPFNPEFHSLEWIRKQFGPGRYQLRFCARVGPEGGRRSRNITVAIDPETLPIPTPASGSSDTTLTAVLLQQNRILLEGLLKKAEPSAGGSDPTLIKLVEGLQQQTNLMLQAAMSKGDSTQSLLAVFERGLEFAADAKFEQDSFMSGIGRVARDLLPVFQEVGKMQLTRPAVPIGPPALKAGHEEPAPAIPAGSILDNVLKQYAPQLLDAVGSGAAPEAVADAVLDSVPPMFYEQFDSLAADRVLGIEPRLGPHRDWVEKLVTALRQRGEGESEAEAE